jgi:hypothetical protein
MARRGRGRHRMIQLPVQSMPINTNVVSSNSIHIEVYSTQHYVIKFVSDLRQVGGFPRVFRFPPPRKLTATIYLKYC